jgi:hypothetical protein
MTTSISANASSLASISPVGPPPAITNRMIGHRPSPMNAAPHTYNHFAQSDHAPSAVTRTLDDNSSIGSALPAHLPKAIRSFHNSSFHRFWPGSAQRTSHFQHVWVDHLEGVANT